MSSNTSSVALFLREVANADRLSVLRDFAALDEVSRFAIIHEVVDLEVGREVLDLYVHAVTCDTSPLVRHEAVFALSCFGGGG